MINFIPESKIKANKTGMKCTRTNNIVILGDITFAISDQLSTIIASTTEYGYVEHGTWNMAHEREIETNIWVQTVEYGNGDTKIGFPKKDRKTFNFPIHSSKSAEK